ncbi:MAG: ABC transporter substrate-binding protein [Gammaproteobacteria bacterium]
MADLKNGFGPVIPDVTAGVKEPFRVAIIQDWGVATQALYDQYDATLLAFEEATASGLLDRPVDLRVLEIEGMPFNTESTVIGAIDKLMREFEPICLIGPHVTETVPAVKPYIEKIGIPMICQSGSLEVAGPWVFLTPNGTFIDEAMLMVDHAVDIFGSKRFGIIREDNLIGDEYTAQIRAHGRRRGLSIVADAAVPSFTTPEEGEAAVKAMQDAGADCYCYLGFGASATSVLLPSKRAFEAGYKANRITMSILMGTTPGLIRPGKTGYGGLIENFNGWTGIEQFDENNKYFMGMIDRFAARFGGRRPIHCYTAQGYDMGHVVAHGLAKAKPLSRDGLRRGLERVRRVPATVGHPGNVMSFGVYDHRAYKGEYIVMREIKDGKSVLAPKVALR